MNFAISTMVTKVLKRAASLVVSFLIAGPAAKVLTDSGVTVNPEVATVAVFGALESLRNLLKNKFGIKYL